MRVSVVVPVHNKAPFIRETFASIFSQTFRDFEVIAVDDRSTDDSLQVLRSLDDPRLRIVPLERNLGEPGAAQHAMDLAQGEYIIRVDADDLCAPERFARQVAFMDARPKLFASGTAMELFGAEQGVWSYPIGPARCKAELLFGCPIVNGACIMRAAALRANGLRFASDWPKVGNDWVFWAHVAMRGDLDNLPDTLLLYRRGEQNSMHGRHQSEYRLAPLRLVMQACGLSPTDEQLRLHVILMGAIRTAPSVDDLHGILRWMEHLRAFNAERGLFDATIFEERMRLAWNRLFYAVSNRDAARAFRMWRMGPARPADQLVYLAKLKVNRMLGRAEPA